MPIKSRPHAETHANPSLPEPVQAAAWAQAGERYDAFVAALGRRLAKEPKLRQQITEDIDPVLPPRTVSRPDASCRAGRTLFCGVRVGSSVLVSPILVEIFGSTGIRIAVPDLFVVGRNKRRAGLGAVGPAEGARPNHHFLINAAQQLPPMVGETGFHPLRIDDGLTVVTQDLRQLSIGVQI